MQHNQLPALTLEKLPQELLPGAHHEVKQVATGGYYLKLPQDLTPGGTSYLKELQSEVTTSYPEGKS